MRRNLCQWLAGLHCAPLTSPFTLVLEFSLGGGRAGTREGELGWQKNASQKQRFGSQHLVAQWGKESR